MINLLIAKIESDIAVNFCHAAPRCLDTLSVTATAPLSQVKQLMHWQTIEASRAKKKPDGQFYGGRLSTVCKNSHLFVRSPPAQVVKDMPGLILSN